MIAVVLAAGGLLVDCSFLDFLSRVVSGHNDLATRRVKHRFLLLALFGLALVLPLILFWV